MSSSIPPSLLNAPKPKFRKPLRTPSFLDLNSTKEEEQFEAEARLFAPSSLISTSSESSETDFSEKILEAKSVETKEPEDSDDGMDVKEVEFGLREGKEKRGGGVRL